MAIRKIRLELEFNEGGVYTVTSPDVPGLVTEGSTPEEILANVQDALQVLLEGWTRRGMEIPEALREEVDATDSIMIQTLVAV